VAQDLLYSIQSGTGFALFNTELMAFCLSAGKKGRYLLKGALLFCAHISWVLLRKIGTCNKGGDRRWWRKRVLLAFYCSLWS
jgi:hypothetical protein